MLKEYYVLYGSQTGNAEHIARDLYDKLTEMGLKSTYSTLNAVKKVNFKETAHAVIIVCSTTGNGDSPENADGFWRWIKARALPKDLCEGLPFSVLGLGDTNYDKFCFMGKSIDKRLNELGGKRIVDLHCADEPTNLEEVVEAWKTKIVAAVKRISASVICGEDTISNVTSDVDCLNLESIKITEDNDAICAIPEGVMSASDVWAALALEGDMCAPPLAKHLPGGAAGAVDHVEILSSSVVPQNTEHVSEMTNTINNSDVGATVAEWTVDKPFISEVVSARYLTDGSTFDDNSVEQPPWGEEKKVVEAILSLSASGISYEPGDSVAICCPNPEYIVNIVLNRLNLSMSDHSPKLTKETLVRVKNCNPCTLGELLSFKLDLVGFPKKTSIMKLSTCCTNPHEASLLQHICSKGDTGKKLWRHFIELQAIGIGELLALFPSCWPSLDQLVGACSPMPPRCYSIASSPHRNPDAVRIAFSIVKYTCCAGVSETGDADKIIRRRGICTTYLESLLEPWLNATNCKSDSPPRETVRLFHKPSINFKLPGSTSYPLILIGPGTGVAPFIGFLEQREALENELQCLKAQRSPDAGAGSRTLSGSNSNIKFGAKECCMGEWRGGIEVEDLPVEGNNVDNFLCSVPSGPIWLFFGCRNTKDFLFQEELQEFVHGSQTLDHLEIAFSRMTSEKVYVQDKMKKRGSELAKLILEQSGYVYICGDGNKMAKEVEAAIVEILVEHGSASAVKNETDAKAVLACMRQRRRFVLDIWS